MVRSAIAPDTMVALVAQKTVWKIINTPIGSPFFIPIPSAREAGSKDYLSLCNEKMDLHRGGIIMYLSDLLAGGMPLEEATELLLNESPLNFS